MFYAAVGIHPENADEFNDDVVKEIKEFVKNEKVKAIGEIGLDYYWEENPPREVQKEVFRAQMKLADELNLPGNYIDPTEILAKADIKKAINI